MTIKIGHHTDATAQTGLTVFLFDHSCPAGVAVPGFAPASHEWALLDPANTVSGIDALLLTGGSAFGLSAVSGVMTFLKEQGRGVETGVMPVPIVPAAAIFDLGVGMPVIPTVEQAYEACLNATATAEHRGRIGVGTGATAGKNALDATPMPAGLGYAELTTESGCWVRAYVAVNPMGDVIDGDRIVTGARFPNGKFADTAGSWRAGKFQQNFTISVQNTVIVALLTNAKLSKLEAHRLAHVATGGIAQAVRPAFTLFDGDAVFAVSCGDVQINASQLAALAQEVVRLAIVRHI